MYITIKQKLSSGDFIFLEGCLQTSLLEKGVFYTYPEWTARRLDDCRALIIESHKEYLRAGCDLLMAHDFLSIPFVQGDGNDGANALEEADQQAFDWLRQAVDESDVLRDIAMAGVIRMAPTVEGEGPAVQGRVLYGKEWTFQEFKPLLERKAESLARAGADLIIIDMARDVDYSLWATEVALTTGLPVWIGIRVERLPDGQFVGFGRQEWSLQDIVSTLMATGAQACFLTQTEISHVSDALEEMKTAWAGPVGVAPNGRFHDRFHEGGALIKPEVYLEQCRRWRRAGVTIFGGGSHILPRHLSSLTYALRMRDGE